MRMVFKILLWLFALFGVVDITLLATNEISDFLSRRPAQANESPILTSPETEASSSFSLPVERIEISAVPQSRLRELTRRACSVHTLEGYSFKPIQECVGEGEDPVTTTPIYYREIAYRDGDKLRQLSYRDRRIQYLQFSPRRTKLGFFYQSSDWWDTSLVIMDLGTRNLKEVYRDDQRTSAWSWRNETEVLVSYNCGTCCQYVRRINIRTGKVMESYQALAEHSEACVPIRPRP